ncbi:MAG: FISUMP domain-containing protein, partial [Bacteroidales bacterium]
TVLSSDHPTTIESVKFHAHLSGPENIDTTGYVYRWDWESDKTWDTKYSAISFISRTFARAGDFTVTVEALSLTGELLTATVALKVSQGFSAPVPDFKVIPDSGNFKTLFTFDAGQTTDAQEGKSLLTFSWDFDNDQNFEIVEKGNPIAHFQFAEAGIHKVNLMVRDTSSLWARLQKTVTVHMTDTLIVPVLRIAPEFPSDRDTLMIFADNSYYMGDPAMPLRFSWKKFSGAWSPPSDNPVFTWPQPPNDTHRIRVRVYSVDNLYNEKEIEVVVSRANRKPTARISQNIRFGNISSIYQFSAWLSSDPENVPSDLVARWDFEGDGIWDTPFDDKKLVTRVFPTAGVYKVTMQIMDTGELKDIAVADVRVSPYSNPTSQIKDVRDEQIYGIVQIGKQWWMGENLNWDMKQSGFGEYYPSYCFDENPAICEVTGRLYLASIIATSYTGETEARNLCPRGYHIPTVDDWLELLQEVGRENAGTDLAYGGRTDFNLLLGGYAAYHHYGGFTEFVPDSLYKVAYFMTNPVSNTVYVLQYKRNDTKVQFREMTPEGYYSVRCVKDR